MMTSIAICSIYPRFRPACVATGFKPSKPRIWSAYIRIGRAATPVSGEFAAIALQLWSRYVRSAWDLQFPANANLPRLPVILTLPL
jgi:hypothetical protein